MAIGSLQEEDRGRQSRPRIGGIVIALLCVGSLQLFGNSQFHLNDSFSSTDHISYGSAVDSESLQELRNQSSSDKHAADNLSSPPFQACLPIYVIPEKTHKEAKGEHAHFVIDGISKSPFFRLTNDPTEGNLWVIDQIRSMGAGGCEAVVLKELENGAAARREKYNGKLHAPLLSNILPTSGNINSTVNLTEWSLIHTDWSDGPGHYKCKEIQKWGLIEVQWAVRSTVRKGKIETHFRDLPSRFNRKQKGWRQGAGPLQDWFLNPPKIALDDPTYMHIPYHVRSDHVQALAKVLENPSRPDIPSVPNFPVEDWDPSRHPRSKDVCHFWPGNWGDTGHPYDSEMRDAVSHTLFQLQNNASHSSITFMVGTRGSMGRSGRLNPQTQYAKQLLDCKVVITTQRDTHEDHYRLMEALASGAMVLSDTMARPPPGFIEGEHMDFFSSRRELEEKIQKYIVLNPEARKDIARNGWKLAMTEYRSWHFMEKLVFGRTVSQGMQEPAANAYCS